MFGKKVAAQAKILADEGYGTAMNSGSEALQREKYVIEVHPEGEPAFRAEVKAWVSWPDKPGVGDVVPVLYKRDTGRVELNLKGDPRLLENR
jgi:hypothetical protein